MGVPQNKHYPLFSNTQELGTSRFMSESRSIKVLRAKGSGRKVPDDFGVFGKRMPVPIYNLTYPKPTKQEIDKSIREAKRRLKGKYATQKG